MTQMTAATSSYCWRMDGAFIPAPCVVPHSGDACDMPPELASLVGVGRDRGGGGGTAAAHSPHVLIT